ncbi:MAG TPA: hypothetical protein DDW85_08405 [Porphyromonadaceae bacterium]|nr:hypothetical protein [Porphyromonadaceae bacterium]
MKFTFNFPDLGEGLEEGTLMEWLVSEGDEVKVGDTIAQMETDKLVADIPSPKSGKIIARYGNPGDIIPVGAPLVDIEVEAEDSASVVGTMELSGEDDLLASSDEGSSQTQKAEQRPGKALATPLARAMAKEMGIDINEVPGSGPEGRVKKEDILNFHTSSQFNTDKKETNLEHTEEVTYQPLTQIRKTIARNMLHSLQSAAQLSIFEEVEISGLKKVIAKYKPEFADRGAKLTYLPFIVKAVAQALKQHPQLNSQIDTENNRMIVRNRIHIAIAVDAPDGLVVPVIRDADRLSIFETARQIGVLAAKARERKLTLEDLKDGSFTVTSFGSIGGIFATPILNYPQAGILGIGRILKTPIVKDDEITVGHILPLSLTVDHRIVDGGETARFISNVMEYLSDPMLFLMRE